MYPYCLFFHIDLYTVCLFLAVVTALVVFRVYFLQHNFSTGVYNFYIISVIISIFFGFICAALLQALFDFIKTGVFHPLSSGFTFYGGLLGGVLVLFVCIFIGNKYILKNGEIIQVLPWFLAVASCAISIAHAIGRLGCFFSGCCYGRLNENGVNMWVENAGEFQKRIPTQLIEAVFLFCLFIVLSVLLFKKFDFVFETYLFSYGVFRFFIEFLRDDDRGEFIIKSLSPAQFISVLLIVSAIVLFIIKIVNNKKHSMLE